LKNQNNRKAHEKKTAEASEIIDGHFKAQEMIARGDYLDARNLLEAIFDGENADIANQLGFIYQQKEFPARNIDLAIKYYGISAKTGNLYGMHGLIASLREKGEIETGLQWMEKASSAGSPKCSFTLYHHHKVSNPKIAENYLFRAIQQGSVPAKQKMAILKLSGRYGFGKIFEGLCECVSNIPDILKYAKDNA